MTQHIPNHLRYSVCGVVPMHDEHTGDSDMGSAWEGLRCMVLEVLNAGVAQRLPGPEWGCHKHDVLLSGCKTAGGYFTKYGV